MSGPPPFLSLRGRDPLSTLVRGAVKANLIHHLAHTGGERVLSRIGRGYRPPQDWLPPDAAPPIVARDARDLSSLEAALSRRLRRQKRDVETLAWRGTLRAFATPTPELAPECAGLEDLRAARALRPDLAWTHVALGLTCVRLWQGDVYFREALASFEAALRLHPGWAWGYLLRSEAKRVLIDYAGALDDLAAALRMEPGLAWAYAFRARILFQRSTDADGLRDMDAALRYEDAGWMRAWRGEAYRRLGRLREAAPDLDAAVRKDPLYDQAYAWRAKWLTETGRPRAALTSLEKGIRLCPAFEKAYRQRIRVLRSLGRTDEALKALNQAARLNHRNSWLGTWRVEGARPGPESEAALRELNGLLAERPRHFWARAWRGEALSQLGRHEEALLELDKVLALRPRSAWPHCWRGECLLRSGRAREALAAFDRAIVLDGDYGRAWAWRARARAALGDWSGAERDLGHALNARRIEYSWLYGWRGEARLRLGRYGEAAADYASALQLDARRPEFIAGLSVARRLASAPA